MFKQAFLISIPATILITIYDYWPKIEFEMAALGVLIFTNLLLVTSQNLQPILKKIGLGLIGIFLAIYSSLLFIHVWGANSITLAASLFFYQIIAVVLKIPSLTIISIVIFYTAIKGEGNLWPTGLHMMLGIFMGAAIAIVLSRLFLDRNPLRTLPNKLVNIIQSYQGIFSTLIKESIEEKNDPDNTNKKIVQTQTLLKESQALLEQSAVTNPELAWGNLVRSLARVANFLIRIQHKISKLQSHLLVQQFASELNSLDRQVQIAFEKIEVGIKTKKIPNLDEFTFLDRSLQDIEDKLSYLRKTREIENYPRISCINFYLLLYPLKQFIQALKQISSNSLPSPVIDKAKSKSLSNSTKPTLTKLADIPGDQWRFMFKTSLACGLALAITYGFWGWGGSGSQGGHYYRYTLYAIVAVMQPTYEAEIFAGLNRTVITVIAAASAAIAYATIGANPFILWFGFFLVIVSARVVGFAGGFVPGAALYFVSIIDYDPTLYNRYFGQRLLETLFGIIFTLAISKLLWPKSESSQLKDQISRGFVKLKNLFGKVLLKYLDNEPISSGDDVDANITAIEQFVKKQLTKENQIGEVLVQNIITLKKPRYSSFYLTYQAELLDKIKVLNYVMAKDEIFLPQEILATNLIEISETIMQNFESIAAGIKNNAEELEIASVLPLFRTLEQKILKLAQEETFTDYPLESMLVMTEILESLKEIADLMEQMKIHWSSPDSSTEIPILAEL